MVRQMDQLEIGKAVERELDGEGGEQEPEHHFGNKHAVLDQMLAHSSGPAKHDDTDCELHNVQSDDEGKQLGRGGLRRCRHQHHTSGGVEEIRHPRRHDGDLERGPAGRQRPMAGSGDTQDEQLMCRRRAPERGAAGGKGRGCPLPVSDGSEGRRPRK
jgi:hypothetical protein